MKKLLLGMLAIVAMIATSCQQEVDLGVNAGETATVSFNINALASRAYSDGKTAQHLQWAVYDASGAYLPDLTGAKDFEISTTVELTLVTGNEYDVIFWAAAEGAPYTVNFAEKTMTVGYTGALSNAENRDAFYKKHHIDVKGAQTETIELRRPFAQLNIGTNDYEAAKKAGYVPTKSSVTVENLGNVLDLWNGDVEGTEATITFATADIKKDEEFPVSGEYEYLAMNYILVGAEKETVNVTFTYANEDGDTKTRTVGSVPVQRNYRTNLYGSILTSDVAINVEIKPEYNEPALGLSELQKAALDGGEVTLTEDVVFTTPLEVYGNLTINLNGKTLSNPNGYAIENYSELTISGEGQVSGMGGIRSHSGKVTIKGGTFTGSSDWNNGTYQHILKAVNTEVAINGGTFDATLGGMTNAMINVSENSVVTINGGTFKNVNGVIPQFAPYMFTYEKNGKLVINDGEFYGGWRFNGETTTTDIYGGNFTVSYDGQSFHASATHVLTIYGGAFSLENGGKLNPASHLAAGVKAVKVGDLYYVLPEVIANAATAENVTAVTENTADIATALATDNGEATMFLWNDVAYIAKYGEVVITSSADEATTVRGVVSNENNEANHPLTSVVIAEGVTDLGDRTFRRCYNLETVVLPSTLTTIGETGTGVFQSCSSLKSIVLPESLTLLGVGTFYGCTSLESINIPAGVTRIEENCLRETGLVSVEFHEGVTYFGAQAFRDCEKLEKVIINAPSFTIESNTFTNMAAPVPTMTIYVVNNEMKAYLESKLTTYDKSYITVVAPNTVSTTEQFTDALSAGGSISLQENIDVTKIDLTNLANDVIIDANGKTITTSSNYGVQVKAGKNITLKNAKVEITVDGNYITYAAGLKIENGDYQGKTITLKDCEIRMCNTDWAYAVNMPASVKNLNLVIDGCTLEGALALQCWGDNNKITVTNSKLICNYTTNAMYTSYCVALQGDGTNNSDNNTLNIRGCEFLYSGVDNFNSTIRAVYNSSNTTGNTITVVDCTYDSKVTAY